MPLASSFEQRLLATLRAVVIPIIFSVLLGLLGGKKIESCTFDQRKGHDGPVFKHFYFTVEETKTQKY